MNGTGTGLLTVPSAAAEESTARHRAFCLQVRRAYPAGGPGESLLPFREVVAIVASSRGGSSLLFDLLRSSGAFLCLDGEHSTLYKLYGLGLPPGPGAHDGTIAAGADTAGFLAALASDVTPGPAVCVRDAGTFAGRALRMLAQQWPGCPLEPGQAWEVIHGAVTRLLSAGVTDPDRLLLAIVRALRKRGWPIDPWYFDLETGLVHREFPELPLRHGPPTGLAQTLEAPPFLVPTAASPPAKRDLRRPLLLKASMDAYRISLLRRLFPDAQLRLIHLTRNPAAAVNGLIDGWRHHGFFSHNLAHRATLSIEGYSGAAAWAGSWWNFDLPPGWPEVTAQPLVSVCAAQWAGAHSAILTGLWDHDAEVLRLRAEEVLDRRRRPDALRRVFQFCGVRPVAPLRARIVVATSPPVPGRWRARARVIEPALADPRVRETSARLGYGPIPAADWA